MYTRETIYPLMLLSVYPSPEVAAGEIEQEEDDEDAVNLFRLTDAGEK